MPYTVWSRGRLIGETDLGFHLMIPNVRMGWFRPAPEADALMEDIAVPTREILAWMLHRGNAVHGADDRASTVYADYAESMQRQESFALELRTQDGSVIAASVSIQNTERLRELAHTDDPASEEPEVPFMPGPFDADAALMHELDVTTGWWEEIEEDPDADWSRDMEDPPCGGHYQVTVILEDPAVLPPPGAG